MATTNVASRAGPASGEAGGFAVIYQELRAVAAAMMRRERGEHTLQPTALVHEACLRLLTQRKLSLENRRQVIAVAARMMRRVLVDHARHRARSKRGGGAVTVALDGLDGEPIRLDGDVHAVDAALRRLEAIDPRKLAVVELHFFGGLSVEETAAELDCSPSSVTRDWRFSKAYLSRELGG